MSDDERESDIWITELERLAVYEFNYKSSVVAAFDTKAWLEYFYEGYSPKEALIEDENET